MLAQGISISTSISIGIGIAQCTICEYYSLSSVGLNISADVFILIGPHSCQSMHALAAIIHVELLLSLSAHFIVNVIRLLDCVCLCE